MSLDSRSCWFLSYVVDWVKEHTLLCSLEYQGSLGSAGTEAGKSWIVGFKSEGGAGLSDLGADRTYCIYKTIQADSVALNPPP